MPSATRRLLFVSVAAAIAIPAIAQVQNNAAPQAQSRAPAAQSQTATQTVPVAETETVVEQQVAAEPPPPPIEYPSYARRDAFTAGALDPVAIGLGAQPWGDASGVFLSGLMRRMSTPLASRWAHIALRDALLAAAHSPRGVNPVDWAAERAWLLLRMGEADAARMVVASVDTDRYTPKMAQVAVQSALASSDPLALCGFPGQVRHSDPRAFPLVEAMCSALNGEPETAADQIDSARRRGSVGGIDLGLAQKIVGAAGDSARSVTIEWEPVDALTAWRYGLSTAAAMSPPDRLMDSAPARVRAWYARAPLISFEDRLQSARIATGLGVFSSQALTDFYSAVYDSTDSNDLGGTDAWQLRLAFAGRDQETRLAAMRRLWDVGDGSLQLEASRAMLGRASARLVPSPDIQSDAPNIVASMLAAGMDKEAATWADAAGRMDDQYSDRVWSMLALAAPEGAAIDLGVGRINEFIRRDQSSGRKRSALLVAGLAALGKLDAAAASRLNARYRLHIERTSPWTQMIDAAARREQAGSVLVLAGTGLQAGGFNAVPSAHLFHIVMALRNTGQDFTARMIAAEALSRT
ncbi:MAG TPA: hypothetical protein VFP53_07715 [Sphingomicrobium sp.]|nr:hypothetical protein [Sphingomicrobium sp.]